MLNKIVNFRRFLHPTLVFTELLCPSPVPPNPFFMRGLSLHFGHLDLTLVNIFFYDLSYLHVLVFVCVTVSMLTTIYTLMLFPLA